MSGGYGEAEHLLVAREGQKVRRGDPAYMRQSITTTAIARAIDIPPTENRSRSDIGCPLGCHLSGAQGKNFLVGQCDLHAHEHGQCRKNKKHGRAADRKQNSIRHRLPLWLLSI